MGLIRVRTGQRLSAVGVICFDRFIGAAYSLDHIGAMVCKVMDMDRLKQGIGHVPFQCSRSARPI